jgi:hypothetical protein
MNRKQHLDRLAAFFRDFAELLEEIPADKRDGVKSQFCAAMGDYLKEMEGGHSETDGLYGCGTGKD